MAYHHGNLREELIDRACIMIEANGLEGLSLRALARDLGVSPAAPSRHFKNRSDLLQMIAKDGYKKLIEATLSSVQEQDIPPLEKMENMTKAFVLWVFDNKTMYKTLLHQDIISKADEELSTLLKFFTDVLKTLIEEAQEMGWRKEEDSNILMHYIISTLHGVCNNISDRMYATTVGAVSLECALKIVSEMYRE